MSNFTEAEEDIFEQMLAGEYDGDVPENPNAEEADEAEEEEEVIEEDEEQEEDDESEDADESTDEDEEESEDDEDTDLEDSEDEEDEPDNDLDGDDDEESDSDEDDEEEDARVDTDDEDDEDADDTSEDVEDEADTEDDPDGEDSKNTDVIDYKAFYEQVTGTEFVVNGKKTTGFKDPAKIRQSQQMAGGFSDKMASFKQYRPYMAPLKARGMLDDPAKFSLAMQLVDGDVEAMKEHMKNLSIDPLELDMDEISYSNSNELASQESIILDDTMEMARSAGIETQVKEVIGSQWDQSSFDEFLANPEVRNDLLDHIRTGAYDSVQDKITEKKQLDVSGQYGNLSSIAQYREAVKELQSEYTSNAAIQQAAEAKASAEATKAEERATAVATSEAKVKREKAKITNERKEAKYKEKAEAESKKLNARRQKASSLSKRKPKSKTKAKFDPMAVEGEELDDLMDFLITQGRD